MIDGQSLALSDFDVAIESEVSPGESYQSCIGIGWGGDATRNLVLIMHSDYD